MPDEETGQGRLLSGVGVNILAAGWGVAEATIFFIVPDVMLTALPLRNLRQSLVACVFVTLGAVVGGLVMFLWARADAESALETIGVLPAISSEMIERVSAELRDHGQLALFSGSFSGTPYKVYAVQAASLPINPAVFALISIPARIVRFVTLALLSAGLCVTVARKLSLRTRLKIHIIFWTAFYVYYFTVMPN